MTGQNNKLTNITKTQSLYQVAATLSLLQALYKLNFAYFGSHFENMDSNIN